MSENKISEINKTLQSIVEKNSILKNNKNNISLIDIDIILSDIRILYQQYTDLTKSLNYQTPVVKAEVEKPSVKKVIKENIPVIKQVEVKQEPVEEVIDIPLKETHTPIEKLEKEPAIEQKQTKSISSDLFNSNDSLTIADKFRDEKTSINDKIGQNKPDKSIADKLKYAQINDIKTLIGINEKYLFINELFEGNMSEYNEFIVKLNNFENISQAHEFISKHKEDKKWKENLESFNKLFELLTRRYNSNS